MKIQTLPSLISSYHTSHETITYSNNKFRNLHIDICYKLQVLEVVTRCNAWSKRLWNEDDDDEDDNGRPSMYLLFVLILKAFYAIQAEKDRLKKKKLKSYIHL